MTKIKFILFCLLTSLVFTKVQAQKEQSRVEILQAEQLLGGSGFERLLTDVILKHKTSLIYCDSAHFYSVTVTSRYAEYDGNTQLALLRNNVVLVNEGTTLYTDFLDYNEPMEKPYILIPGWSRTVPMY